MRRTWQYRRYRELIIPWRRRRRRRLVTDRSPWPNWKIDLLTWGSVLLWMIALGVAAWRTRGDFD